MICRLLLQGIKHLSKRNSKLSKRCKYIIKSITNPSGIKTLRSTKEMFEGENVDTVRLIDYLAWIAGGDNDNHTLIALPPIQRSPVWKPAQVIDLWDSLLRGMPIGSFLVGRMRERNPRREFNMADQAYPNKEGFFLLDGQQRTLVLCHTSNLG
jgi:hypothetical protein